MAFWHLNQLIDHGYLKYLHGEGQKLALTVLASFMADDGERRVSQETLAKRCGGISTRTVARALEQAEDLKLISRHRQGRRQAEVIRWHACPPDCAKASHTGKTDTARPLLSKESTADGFPKPKKRRVRFEDKKPVPLTGQIVTTEASSETGQIVTKPGVSDKLSPLKGTNHLVKEEVSVKGETVDKQSGQIVTTEAYIALCEAVEKLVLTVTLEEWTAEAIETEVLLELLTDHSSSVPQLDVAALAVELWGEIPSEITHDHSEWLLRHLAQVADINTLRLHTAILDYYQQPTASTPWHDLSNTFRTGYVEQVTRKVSQIPTRLSQVAPTLTETASPLKLAYSFPPKDVQVEQLTQRLSQLAPE